MADEAQTQHAQELALAREVQRQMGGSLLEARGVINEQGMENERKATEFKTLLNEVKRLIRESEDRLRICGPAVSGDYRSGFIVNAEEQEDAVSPLPDGINGDILVHDGMDWVVLHSPGDDGLYALTASVSGGVPTINWTETTEACPG